MKITQQELESVKNVLLPTWQSVVAIAYHAQIKPKKTLSIVRYLRDKLDLVETRDCRMDGHNPVWLAKLKVKEVIKKPKENKQPCLKLELEI